MVESIKTEQIESWKSLPQNRKKRRNEDSLRDFRDNIKGTDVCMKQVPEGEERKREPKKIYEDLIAEKFPNRGKERVPQVQEAETIPYRMNILMNSLPQN